jgi:hypothetical protein
MKIIGKTAEGLLLSASKDELANMVGFYWSGSEGCPPLEPGAEIKCAAMFDQLRTLASNQKALGDIATKLRMVADLLELNDPLVQKLTVE